MKKSLRSLVILTAIFLSSCDDNDSVPLVQDPKHPVDAKGNSISTEAFLEKYCFNKNGREKTDETCKKVRGAHAHKIFGKVPEGW